MQLANDAPPDIPAFVHGDVRLIKLSVLEGPWVGLSSQQALVAYLEGTARQIPVERYGIGPVRDLLDRVSKGEPFPAAFEDRILCRMRNSSVGDRASQSDIGERRT